MKVCIEEQRLSLTMESIRMGEDLNISLYGGDRPHIGAVALSSVSSAASSRKKCVSVSLITLPGHKEDLLARETALTLSKCLDRNCSVSCGIHLENIEEAEISLVMELSRKLCSRFIEAFLKEDE